MHVHSVRSRRRGWSISTWGGVHDVRPKAPCECKFVANATKRTSYTGIGGKCAPTVLTLSLRSLTLVLLTWLRCSALSSAAPRRSSHPLNEMGTLLESSALNATQQRCLKNRVAVSVDSRVSLPFGTRAKIPVTSASKNRKTISRIWRHFLAGMQRLPVKTLKNLLRRTIRYTVRSPAFPTSVNFV